jgi:hypothetical protein
LSEADLADEGPSVIDEWKAVISVPHIQFHTTTTSQKYLDL